MILNVPFYFQRFVVKILGYPRIQDWHFTPNMKFRKWGNGSIHARLLLMKNWSFLQLNWIKVTWDKRDRTWLLLNSRYGGKMNDKEKNECSSRRNPKTRLMAGNAMKMNPSRQHHQTKLPQHPNHTSNLQTYRTICLHLNYYVRIAFPVMDRIRATCSMTQIFTE